MLCELSKLVDVDSDSRYIILLNEEINFCHYNSFIHTEH